jgi:carboxymethylenebutenolidase
MRSMLTAADGHRFDAHFALPKGKPRGGLVVVQEAFGVNAYVKGVCERFAAEGYACLAPALYDRQQRNAAFDSHEGEHLAMARKLRAGLVWSDVLKDMAASVERLREFGRVGVVGYCVGGSVTWLAALELEIAAASSYYGRDVIDFLSQPPRCPVLLHFGDRDHLIPMKDIEKIKTVYADAVHVYPAGHGFDREDSDAARLARRRTLEHFERHVAGGS